MKPEYASKLVFIITVCLGLSAPPCRGTEKSTRSRLFPEQALKHQLPPVLFEIERQDEILKGLSTLEPSSTPTSPLLPNRVYLVYSENEKRWLWKVTDFEGEFAEPPEALRTLSIFPGSFVGAKDPTQHFGLNLDRAIWVRTFQPEKQIYWIYSIPPEKPKIKTVSYKSLPSAKGTKK